MIIGLMGQAGAGKDTAGAVIAKELGGVTMAFADPIKRWCHNALKLNIDQLWGNKKEKLLSKRQLKRQTSGVRLMSYLAHACWETPGAGMWGSNEYEISLQGWWKSIKTKRGLTPRLVMQHFGTEFVRQRLSPTLWIDTGLNIAARLLKGGLSYDRVHGVRLAIRHINAVVITDVRFRNEVLAIKRAGGLVFRIERNGGSRTELKNHASEVEQSSVPQFWLDGTIVNRYPTKSQFEHAVRHLTLNRLKSRGGVVN